MVGPLLFVFYINDLGACLKHDNVTLIQFADDSTILCKSGSLVKITEIANEMLNRLYLWCLINRMKVNVDKTYVITFGLADFSDVTQLNVMYNNVRVNYMQSVKILGVTFEKKLNFREHIKDLCKTLSWKISIMHRARNYLPQSIRLKLYYAHVQSHLYYANIIWVSASTSTLSPLFLLQKRAIRIVANVPYRSHTDTIFRHLGVIKIHDVFNYKLCLLLKNMNARLFNLLELNTYVSSYNTRTTVR